MVKGRWKSFSDGETEAGWGLPLKVCLRAVSLGNQKQIALAEGGCSYGTWVSKLRGSLSYKVALNRALQPGKEKARCSPWKYTCQYNMKIRFMALAGWAWIIHAQEMVHGAPGVERAVGDEDCGIFLYVSSALRAGGAEGLGSPSHCNSCLQPWCPAKFCPHLHNGNLDFDQRFSLLLRPYVSHNYDFCQNPWALGAFCQE